MFDGGRAFYFSLVVGKTICECVERVSNLKKLVVRLFVCVILVIVLLQMLVPWNNNFLQHRAACLWILSSAFIFF